MNLSPDIILYGYLILTVHLLLLIDRFPVKKLDWGETSYLNAILPLLLRDITCHVHTAVTHEWVRTLDVAHTAWENVSKFDKTEHFCLTFCDIDGKFVSHSPVEL